MDWIDLPQDTDRWRTLVNSVMNSWAPYNGKCCSDCTTGSFWKVAEIHGTSYHSSLPCRHGGAKFLRNVGVFEAVHGVTSQKTPFFIVTAVKTSDRP
jgi:hypothetical protein